MLIYLPTYSVYAAYVYENLILYKTDSDVVKGHKGHNS